MGVSIATVREGVGHGGRCETGRAAGVLRYGSTGDRRSWWHCDPRPHEGHATLAAASRRWSFSAGVSPFSATEKRSKL
jgi:hypothetical protein